MSVKLNLCVILIVSISLLINAVSSATFTPEEIYPCTFQPVSEVHCNGPEITDDVLKHIGQILGYGEIRLLSINDTGVTSIPNNWTQAIIEGIFIERNAHLKEVHANAFRKSPAISGLIIRDNPLLADPNIIVLAKYLAPKDTVMITGNALTEIPANALSVPESDNSRLRHIYFSKNKIKKVGANAFLGHPNLLILGIDENGLEVLENDSLSLTHSHQPMVRVFLDDNNLTAKSFAPRTFGELQFNSILLDLENNKMQDLPESVFRQFFKFRGSQVFLYNNTVSCNCSMKWLLEPDINDNVLGLYCANLQKSINGLTEQEIGCSS